MADEIDKIIKNSSKAELLEALASELEVSDKAVVVTVADKDASYSVRVMMLGIEHDYEACGILEVAQHDIIKED